MRRHSRRHFIGALAALVPAASGRSLSARGGAAARSLTLHHTHTGEKLSVAYFERGTYIPDALATLNHFLRDFRTGDVHPIDADLLDLLFGLTRLTDTRLPFQIISGYRSPATNAVLRRASEGVAAGSLHMKGQAIDIRLADVPLPKLRAAALAVRRGGVGYYPSSGFVHVDTGRVRTW